MNWIFDNPRRLWTVFVLGAISASLLALVLLGVRVARLVPAADVVSTSTPIALTPPTPVTLAPMPSRSPDGSAPIALEAVDAFLLHDLTRFSALAVPEVAEEVAEAPAPQSGGTITGPAQIIHDGPTQQDVRVPTTLGDLDLTMATLDAGAWTVLDMRYHR